MSTVLVTGATGLVGRHAVPALQRAGFTVIAVTRREADLLDPAQRRGLIATHRPSHWLHLAWETRPGYFWSAPENDSWLDASRDLLARFAGAGGRRVVMAGSCAEYDWTKLSARPVAEDAPIGPSTRYGKAKGALFAALAKSGLSHANGRLFFMIGAGEHPDRLAPQVARALLAGRPADCTAGTQVRDFIHPRDAGEAFAALLASDVTGAVNIARGEPHTVSAVAQALGRLAGRLDLVRLGALPDRPDDPPSLVADTGRLRNEVGFAPSLDFDAMIADAFQYWRQRAC
jgi:nucleoside-diphosphate-sugar epimerase